MNTILGRVHSRYQRAAARLLHTRRFRWPGSRPFISFTFDDYPVSSLRTGGSILEAEGARGTYYTSLGLAGQRIPAGLAFSHEDLLDTVARGHELGCHTYDHLHSWDTPPRVFQESVLRNQRELERLIPGKRFETLSYPISRPRPGTKRLMSGAFAGCRSGGQSINSGVIDLNLMYSVFIEKLNNDRSRVEGLIQANCAANGWLIFSTHDVSEAPTPYGCTPGFFEFIVKTARQSGASILPVAEVLRNSNATA